jgi:hypothetical protein
MLHSLTIFFATIDYYAFLLSLHCLTFFVYSQFADLIERDGAAKATLEYRSATVFAPTNQAFQRYPDLKVNVLYHMSKCDCSDYVN